MTQAIRASLQSKVCGGRRRTDLNLGVTALLAMVPVIATCVSTMQGPGLSPDSVAYLSAGLNLAEGDGLLKYTGGTLTVFPPGLPLLIAIGEICGLEKEWTVRLLNACSFALIVVLSSVLLHSLVANRRLAHGATLFISVSVSLLGVARMAWTEPLFLALSLFFVFGLKSALTGPHLKRWIVACAVLVWASFFVRYAGVSLLPIGGATLLLGLWRMGRVLALRYALAFVALGSLGPMVWMFRNHSVDGTLMGPRSPNRTDTLVLIGKRIFGTLGDWLFPNWVPDANLTKVGLGFVVALICGAAFVLLNTKRQDAEQLMVSLLPVVVFGFGYVAYLTVAKITTSFVWTGSRLLVPIFVPLVVVTTVVLDRLAVGVKVPVRRGAHFALLLLVALQGHTYINDARLSGVKGVGYASIEWKRSELIEATRSLPSSAVLYSDRPDGIWAVTGREPMLMSPSVATNGTFLRNVACAEAYLAWFDIRRGWLATLEEIAEVVVLEPVVQTSVGTLYKLGLNDQAECAAAVD